MNIKTTSKNILQSNIPLLIRISVTGHRDLKATDELKKRIRTALTVSINDIINPKRNKNFTPLNYEIITPLADGADRIIALETKKVLNAQIEVVLPMLKEEYAQTFLSNDSVLEFESLLKQASHVRTLIDRPLQEYFPTLELKNCKDVAFQKVGRYVVDHSDILIALWNGNESNNKGGTAEIINYARSIKRTLIIISSEAPHQIFIETGDGFIMSSYERFEFFNNYRITDEEQKKYVDNYSENMFDNPECKKLNPENVEFIKEKLLPFYVRTSKIAKKYQNIYQKSGLAVYLLAPLAVTCVACGIIIHHLSLLFFALEFLILLSIITIIFYSDSTKAHKNWIQYRYLTEQIRTALFFTACGFNPRPIKISSHLRVAHKPDDWMVRMFDEILKRISDIPKYKKEDFRILLDYIKEHWIIDQLNFHKKKWETSWRKSHNLEKLGGLVFVLAIVMAAIHILLVISGNELHYKWFSDYITLAAITLPALGASFGAIRNHREYSRIGKRSENMYYILKELLEECDNVRSMDDLNNLLNKLEEETLHESQDWLMLMKFLKVEPI